MTINIINVKDAPYSAVGNNVADDRAAIQSAIDAAFGTSSAPNGSNSPHLNRPLYFPAGRYKCNSALNFTQVYGGWIFGDGRETTSINFGDTFPSGATGFNINGMSRTLMENFTVHMGFPTVVNNNVGIELNWNGTTLGGTVGLSYNTFRNMAMEGSTCLRIANSGNQGHGNSFEHCIFPNAAIIGLHIKGANAHGNVAFYTIGQGSERCVKIDGGDQFTWIGITEAATPTGIDIEITNNAIVYIAGCRTESLNCFLKVTGAATVICSGLQCSDATDHFCELNHPDAVLIVDGSALSPIRGTGGDLYLRGVFRRQTEGSGFPDTSGFSGNIIQRI